MSLFDYHGRFSKSQKGLNDSGEEYIAALESATKEGSESEETNSSAVHVRAEKAEVSEESSSSALQEDVSDQERTSTDDEVQNASDDSQTDESDESENDRDDLREPEEGSDDDTVEMDDAAKSGDSKAVAEADGGSEEEAADEESDSDEPADDETTAQQDNEDNRDSGEGSSEGSTEEKLSKKKKTPASKGKHAAGAYALPLEDDDTLSIPRKSHGALKGLGITLSILVILGVLAYFAGVLVFMNRILPNTAVGNHDISLYTNEEAVQLLESIENNYAIEVKMGTFSYKVTKAEIGLQLDASEVIEAFHEKYDAFKWPFYIFAGSHDISDELNVTFDPAGYEQGFLEAVAEYNKTATPPTAAFIYFDEGSKRYLIEDEIMGTQIDPAASLAALTQAIHDLQPILRLTEAELVQPSARANDEYLIESAKLATSLITAKISLMVNDSAVRDITHAELAKCIQINEKSEVAFDEKALEELCAAVAQEFNTIGTERTYTRADGKVITVSGGVYGWEVDKVALQKALLETIKVGDSATVVVPFETTADAYVGPGQRDWGNRFIDIDLTEQHVRFYDDAGNLMWETDCITGSPDGYHNTPQGVWRVNDKESPSRLVGYEGGKQIYVSYVSYWMPFIKNSIGLHDATWQPSFGGSMYANGYGSHGCVNLSYAAAQELWNIIRVGDVVVTHF